MAQKRMFDRAIIDTDSFIDLSMSMKGLYFLLGMEADDEGFVSPKKVLRVHTASEDDLKVLIAKKLVIPFKSGVVVITHWNENNYLDKNRIKQTQYQDEKRMLALTESGKYVLNNRSTSIEESSIVESSTEDIDLFEVFWTEYPPTRKQDKRKCLDKWKKVIKETSAKSIVDDVKSRKSRHSDWVKNNGQFVPAPLVYLNNARWEAPIIEDVKATQKPALVFGGK